MKKVYCIKCNKYKKLKKIKISYIFDKILVFSIIFEKVFKKEESVTNSWFN